MKGYDFKFSKNDSDKTICVCKTDGCLFGDYASYSQDKIKYILKTLRPDIIMVELQIISDAKLRSKEVLGAF